jgi:hypothetical protein
MKNSKTVSNSLRPQTIQRNIVTPRRSKHRFYGHGLPGLDPDQLSGKLIVV